jgi:hypothetical protein
MMVDIKTINERINSAISYDGSNHSYTRNSDGKLLAGVSSVSELAKSKDAGNFLAQWKVNESIIYIDTNWDVKKEYTKAEKAQILKDSKYAHKTKSKDATDIGTFFHDFLEQYIKSRIENKPFHNPINNISLSTAFIEFLKWEKKNKVEWIASELLVYNEELELAGRLDAIAYVNGKITIIDFKVANSVSPGYYLQTAGYWLCLEAMGIIPEDRLIIRLPKTEKRKVWNNELKQYNMVDNVIEFLQVPTDIGFDKQTFISCRQIYKWINQALIN